MRYGHIDTAIIALPYVVEGLHSFEFWAEDFFAIFPKGDSHTGLSHINSDELSKTNLLLLGEGHCLTDHALSVCALDKEDIKSGFADASLHTIIQMALAGMGTTLVPKMALDQISGGEVVAIPVSEKGPHRRLAFITRLNYARVNDVKILSEIFHGVLSQE